MKKIMDKHNSYLGKVGIGGLLFLVCLVLLSCSHKQQNGNSANHMPKTKIVVLHGWGTTSREDEFMREIYQSFEKENPDIALSLVSVPSFESLEEKAQDMLAVGSVPNIIYTGAGGSQTIYNFMVEQESAVDLMPYLLEDEVFKESISPLILERWTTQDQKLYTVSDLLEVKGYWYNKKIFANAGVEEIPRTWKEFTEACQKIRNWSKEKKLSTVVMDFDSKKSAVVMQALLPEVTKHNDSYPLGEHSFSFLQNLFVLKKIYQENEIAVVENIYRDPLFSFRTGHSAMYIGEIWEAREFSENLEVGFAMFPNSDGQMQPQVSAGVGYLIGSWGSKEQQEASVRFIKYMLSYPIQMKIMWETGRIPSNPRIDLEVLKNQKGRQYEAYKATFQKQDYKGTPETSWNSYVYRKFVNKVQTYLEGNLSERGFVQYIVGNGPK